MILFDHESYRQLQNERPESIINRHLYKELEALYGWFVYYPRVADVVDGQNRLREYEKRQVMFLYELTKQTTQKRNIKELDIPVVGGLSGLQPKTLFVPATFDDFVDQLIGQIRIRDEIVKSGKGFRPILVDTPSLSVEELINELENLKQEYRQRYVSDGISQVGPNYLQGVFDAIRNGLYQFLPAPIRERLPSWLRPQQEPEKRASKPIRKVAVVMAASNEEATIGNALGGLVRELEAMTTEPSEIVVVVNNTTDNTAGEVEKVQTELRQRSSSVKIMILSSASGKVNALKAGLEAIRYGDGYDAVIFADSDIEISDGSLGKLRDALQNDGQLKAVGGKTQPPPAQTARPYSKWADIARVGLQYHGEPGRGFTFLSGQLWMGRPEYLQDVFGAMPVNTLNEDIYTSIILGSDSVRVLTDVPVYHPLPETEGEFRRQMTRWIAANEQLRNWFGTARVAPIINDSTTNVFFQTVRGLFTGSLTFSELIHYTQALFVYPGVRRDAEQYLRDRNGYEKVYQGESPWQRNGQAKLQEERPVPATGIEVGAKEIIDNQTQGCDPISFRFIPRVYADSAPAGTSGGCAWWARTIGPRGRDLAKTYGWQMPNRVIFGNLFASALVFNIGSDGGPLKSLIDFLVNLSPTETTVVMSVVGAVTLVSGWALWEMLKQWLGGGVKKPPGMTLDEYLKTRKPGEYEPPDVDADEIIEKFTKEQKRKKR